MGIQSTIAGNGRGHTAESRIQLTQSNERLCSAHLFLFYSGPHPIVQLAFNVSFVTSVNLA